MSGGGEGERWDGDAGWVPGGIGQGVEAEGWWRSEWWRRGLKVKRFSNGIAAASRDVV